MKRFAVVCVLGLLTAGICWYSYSKSTRPLDRAAADRLLELAIKDADNNRVDTAMNYLERILKDVPDHHRARETQATLYIHLRKPAEAAEAIAALPDEYLQGRFPESVELAKFVMRFGFLFEAEPLLLRLLAMNPNHADVRKELIRCYRIGGENTKAAPLILAAFRDRRVAMSDLLMVSAPRLYWASVEDVAFMKRMGQKHNDPYTMLGYGRRELEQGNLVSAIQILNRLRSSQPDWTPSQIRLTYAEWLSGNTDDWQRHMAGWTADRLDDADGWFLWGAWHRQQRQPQIAARCFFEALIRTPKHLGALSQLSAVLHELRFEVESLVLKTYGEQLAEVEQTCQDVGHKSSPEMVAKLIEDCAAVGWETESQAWLRLARNQWPESTWPELATGSASDSKDATNSGHPALRLLREFDFRQFPLPVSLKPELQTGDESRLPPVKPVSWRLEDEAKDLGIHFRFANGLDPERKRAYMFEFAGPGIGVIDYDGDDWPDLHLTQGAHWPLQSEEDSLFDELFHNLGDGTFAPVAELAGVNEPGYSQGPSVGDYDSDGFPDLYICNIGPNRCYRNNGDGTFTETTAVTGTAGDDWSISAAWADLNDDGLLDLYVVNYLTGDVFERACTAADGRAVQCPPMQFPAADDCLYLNRGDGTFEDVSARAGIDVPNGKGMGIVVGRLNATGKNSIFIANDTTANFLFSPSPESSEIPRFEELGTIVGVAFGPRGNAQSSMGIAAGDVDGNGRLDLFVTNWMAETSNLFIQIMDGQFDDQASRFGLTTDGLMMEGWGTQFFDFDADGDLDLFAANGHLEEHDAKGGRMPQHLFRNHQGKRLELVSSPQISRYFSRQYLGRAVAVWDWNRDGSLDIAVSHVTDPVAILTNKTPDVGHSLSLRLIGVQTARDPVGTQVILTSGSEKWERQVFAGDGYTATNERKLYFGVASSEDDVDIHVRWPDGSTQELPHVAVDAEYVIVQGRNAAIPVRHRSSANSQSAQ